MYNNFPEKLILMLTKPTVAELNEKLIDLKEWERFALHLTEIRSSHIETIKRDNASTSDQKLALFETWLGARFGVSSTASWIDVVVALIKAEERILAVKLIQSHQKNNKKVSKAITFSQYKFVVKRFCLSVSVLCLL